MSEVKIVLDQSMKKIIVDGVPNIGDNTGEQMLRHLEQSVGECRKAINDGYRVTTVWSGPDTGIEFILKKRSC